MTKSYKDRKAALELSFDDYLQIVQNTIADLKSGQQKLTGSILRELNQFFRTAHDRVEELAAKELKDAEEEKLWADAIASLPPELRNQEPVPRKEEPLAID